MAKPRRRRIRRVAKWAGALLCVVIAALWASSVIWNYSRLDNRPGSWVGVIGFEDGCFGALFATRDRGPRSWADMEAEVVWMARRRGAYPSDSLWWWPQERGTGDVVSVLIPMWMPLAIVGAPTAWLWWRGRRRARPGHCPCGYDLTGLAPGAPCPECGPEARR